MPDSRLLLGVATLFAIGALLVHFAHRWEPPLRRRGDWVKYGVYAIVINILWASAWVGRAATGALLAAIALLGVREVSRIVPARLRVAVTATAAILLSAALAQPLLCIGDAWRGRFAFVVLVTAATDSFAQLTGRLVGGPRLCPWLSPNKTVAGLVGGLSMGLTVAVLLGFLVSAAPADLALLGLATAAAAVGGDLAFSFVKRRAGVKDFSSLLPGHGGVLDRFDSLILAIPTFHWVSRTLQV